MTETSYKEKLQTIYWFTAVLYFITGIVEIVSGLV